MNYQEDKAIEKKEFEEMLEEYNLKFLGMRKGIAVFECKDCGETIIDVKHHECNTKNKN